MKYNFLRPQDAYSLDDFESKITELAMKIDRDFGSFKDAAVIGEALLEAAKPNLSEDQIPQFMKLISHFQFLSELAAKHQSDYLDIQAELNSYITGNFVFDEENRQLVYLDHKDFKNKYPNFKPNGTL